MSDLPKPYLFLYSDSIYYSIGSFGTPRAMRASAKIVVPRAEPKDCSSIRASIAGNP